MDGLDESIWTQVTSPKMTSAQQPSFDFSNPDPSIKIPSNCKQQAESSHLHRHKKIHSNYYQHSTISMEDHEMTIPQCDHRSAIEDLNRSLEVNTQLKVLVLQSIQVAAAGDGRLIKLVEGMFKEMRSCSESALSKLQNSGNGSGSSSTGAGQSDVSVESGSSGLGKRKHLEGRCNMVDSSRIRRKKCSWITLTAVPYEDGYQWRKYGQKDIKGHKYPRCYYRCTYSKEEGCAATKSIQQADCEENPAKFIVRNCAQHTCKARADSGDHYLAESNTDIQCQPREEASTSTSYCTGSCKALDAVGQAHNQEQIYQAISPPLPLIEVNIEPKVSEEIKISNLTVVGEQTVMEIENSYDWDSLSYWRTLDHLMFADQMDI